MNRRGWFASILGAIGITFGATKVAPVSYYISGGVPLSDYDILTKVHHYTDANARQMINLMKQRRLEELKLEILAQNPCIFGVKNA